MTARSERVTRMYRATRELRSEVERERPCKVDKSVMRRSFPTCGDLERGLHVWVRKHLFWREKCSCRIMSLPESICVVVTGK
jgi:hypothetical protein